ncbi:MAG: DNA-directed RNA polymerase subunit RpoH/Rpb5 C-terminal domain-containing protein [Candidatus Aenigmatarchaeota archaeon]
MEQKVKKDIKDIIFNHFLSPKYSILSEEEKEELLKKYGAKLHQLPKILVTDPVVKALGAKVGDVIKIERDILGIKSIYYRVVVEK